MITEKTPVIRATKDILARCMATEDIRVIHDAESETAYFDTENRVLCLPIWKDMSNSMYDMLVGHEVSHALHTPAKGWQKFVGEGKGSRIRHMFLNIVEDARIERLIKDKFPGLRRDFSVAYHEFADRDLFELANRTIDTNLPLIDRLNIHFKIGLFGIEDIPFLANEQQYVTRMANTKTFKDVMVLAKDLYEKHQDELDDEDDRNGSQLQVGDGEESTEQGDSCQSSNDTGEPQDGSQSGSNSEDGDEDGSQSQSGNGDGEDDSESQSDGNSDGNSDDESQNDSNSNDNSDGDSEGDSDGGQPSRLEYDDYSEKGGAGSTQHNYEKNIGNLRDSNSDAYEYHTLPTMKIENCVVDYNQVRSIWENHETKVSTPNQHGVTPVGYTDSRIKSTQECTEFLSRIKTTVQNMVQQFQMKQAADADKRTSIAKTGILDTTNMINYRWSEDIFLKNEVHADSKNHGIVMYIDWSGSMNGILKDTIEQLLILTEFCQKVNIPFDVYAFTSKRINGEYNEETGEYLETQYVVDDTDKQLMKPHRFSLIQFLSSDMKTNEYKQAVQDLYHLGISHQNWRGRTAMPSEFDTGCTPLNEAVVSAIQMVPVFQAKHNIQIVNTVFLTDGDGHSMGAGSYYGKSHVHDPKTRKDYAVERSGRYGTETAVYLQILRERTGANIIGIRLHASKSIRNLQYRYFADKDMNEYKKSWKKHNFCSVVIDGYDRLFIVRGNLEVETDLLSNVADDASLVKLKNAFMKGANNAKGSRVIASQIIDIISV